MEMYGICLGLPMSFVMGSAYHGMVKVAAARWAFIRRPFFWVSALVLSLLVVEFLAVAYVGTVALRESIGSCFVPAHTVVFLLALPSLVNVLTLQTKSRFLSIWPVRGVACLLAWLPLVLLQYHVTECLSKGNGAV